LTPDLERGGEIKRVKADTVEVEYSDGANATTTFTAIDGLLADLVTGTSASNIDSYEMLLS
jgi:ABC-type sulfate transport system substrate-binding protein